MGKMHKGIDINKKNIYQHERKQRNRNEIQKKEKEKAKKKENRKTRKRMDYIKVKVNLRVLGISPKDALVGVPSPRSHQRSRPRTVQV